MSTHEQAQKTRRRIRAGDVARICGVSIVVARALMATGKIPAVRLGRQYFAFADDVHRYLEQARTDAGQEVAS